MIPRSIGKEHILKAITEIDENGVRRGRESNRWLLKYNGKSYPPKYVISIANRYANNVELKNFSGGPETNNFLKRLGFSIIEKEAIEEAEVAVETEEGYIETRLSLERDLEEYIVRNLKQIEEGLRLFKKEMLTGRQFDTDVGRIDILATDRNNNYVVIELKAGLANYSVIGQILAYIRTIRQNIANGKDVRGFIIADDFDKKLMSAISEIPHVSLKRYRVNFTFEDVEK